MLVCFAATPAWANGDGFFSSTEIPGNPEYVIFGNVRDERGKYLEGAVVRVYVAQHMLEVNAKTDVIVRFRTPDVGVAIQDLGYEVDLSLITISVQLPGYREARREYRGKYRQTKGAIEINFRMTRISKDKP
jgi:hypothetical protein